MFTKYSANRLFAVFIFSMFAMLNLYKPRELITSIIFFVPLIIFLQSENILANDRDSWLRKFCVFTGQVLPTLVKRFKILTKPVTYLQGRGLRNRSESSKSQEIEEQAVLILDPRLIWRAGWSFRSGRSSKKSSIKSGRSSIDVNSVDILLYILLLFKIILLIRLNSKIPWKYDKF